MGNPLLTNQSGSENPWYALKHKTNGWLVDTCAGGSYSDDFGASVWFDHAQDAWDALRAAEIDKEGHELAKISLMPSGNHYKIEWPDRPCNIHGAVFPNTGLFAK